MTATPNAPIRVVVITSTIENRSDPFQVILIPYRWPRRETLEIKLMA